VAELVGNKVKDAHGRLVGEFDARYVKNAHGHRVAEFDGGTSRTSTAEGSSR